MAKVGNQNVIIRERHRWLFLGLPLSFTTYTLTDKKLLVRKGFLSTSEEEVLLYRVLDMSKSRSLAQRLVGLGTLKVYSSDRTSPEIVMNNIRHIDAFADYLSENVEKERLRVKFRASEIIDHDSNDADEYDSHSFL